jgi:hypothetical protein
MRLIAFMALALVVSSCSPSGTDDGGDTSSRCKAATPAMVSKIESALTVDGGGSLSNAYIVRSDDFEHVYFVAARIHGPGMEDAVGVWGVNDPGGGGLLFSANAMAEEFMGMGRGPGFSSSDDGLQEAESCARG